MLLLGERFDLQNILHFYHIVERKYKNKFIFLDFWCHQNWFRTCASKQIFFIATDFSSRTSGCPSEEYSFVSELCHVVHVPCLCISIRGHNSRDCTEIMIDPCLRPSVLSTLRSLVGLQPRAAHSTQPTKLRIVDCTKTGNHLTI